MGQNLALNIADHGFQISVYNRTTEKTDKFVAENPNTPGGLVGTKTLEEFVQSLAKPRKMVILVQAGKGTDAVIDGLVPLLERATSSSTAATRSGPTRSAAKSAARKRPPLHRLRRVRRRGGRALRPVAHARRRPAAWQGTEADLGGHRRQGRRQDRQADPGARPASPSSAACPAPPTSAKTAPATTSRWSTTASSTATCR
jgi:hypothetical protein